MPLANLLEQYIDFDREISVIAARSANGEVAIFPAVECVFHPEYNLVDYLSSPSSAAPAVLEKAEAIARKVVESLEIVGLLAVEMFVTKSGEVLVNEVAPRPHNSGHQTINANYTWSKTIDNSGSLAIADFPEDPYRRDLERANGDVDPEYRLLEPGHGRLDPGATTPESRHT